MQDKQVGPSPSGLCMCGCGRKTKIVTKRKTATRLLEVSPSTVKRMVRDGPRAQSSRSWAPSRLLCEPQIAGGTYRLNITATSGSFNIWVGVN